MRVVHDFRFRYVKKCHCQSRCLPLLFSRLLASLIEVSARSSVRSSLLPSVRWFVRPFVRPSVRRLHTRNTILGLNFDKHMNKLYHFRDNSETDLRADNQNTSNVQWRSHLIFHPTSFFRLSRSPSITSNVICLKIDRFLANLNDTIQLLIESKKLLSFCFWVALFLYHKMRCRISLRGRVRPSVCPSVRPSVRLSVPCFFFEGEKYAF